MDFIVDTEEINLVTTYINSLSKDKLSSLKAETDSIILNRPELNREEIRNLILYVTSKYGSSKVSDIINKAYNSVIEGLQNSPQSKAMMVFYLLHNIVVDELNTREVGVLSIGEERKSNKGKFVDFAFWIDGDVVLYRSFKVDFYTKFLDGSIRIYDKIKLITRKDSKGKFIIIDPKMQMLNSKMTTSSEEIIQAILKDKHFINITSPIIKLIQDNQYAHFYCQGIVGLKVDNFHFNFQVILDDFVSETVFINSEDLLPGNIYFVLGTISKSKKSENTYVIYPTIMVDLNPEGGGVL